MPIIVPPGNGSATEDGLYQHSFRGVTPTPVFSENGQPASAWTHIIFRVSPTADGTFTPIDEQTIAEDLTPGDPNPLDVTTSLCPTSTGYFDFLFRRGTTFSPPSAAVQSPSAGETAGTVPTVDQVGALLHARTFVSGVARGTFDEDTYPTRSSVETLCRIAGRDLVGFLVDEIPDDLLEDVRTAAAYNAAVLVESSYFGDQDTDQASPRSLYSAIYLRSRDTLLEQVRIQVNRYLG